MHEICCKLSGTKKNITNGEPCNNFKECPNSSSCGAIEPIKRTQYGGIITGSNHTYNKAIDPILTQMDKTRSRRVK